jgi:serine/threonine protein kinase
MSDWEEKLQQAKRLLDSGIIDRQEFDEIKEEALANMGIGSGIFSMPTMIRVGAYRVLKKIGQGGMGVVYRARHQNPQIAQRQGGDVALKVMHPHFANKKDLRERFNKEASMGLKLDHPGIVKVHDLLEDQGQLGLVMELVEGKPLSVVIGVEVGPIPWDKAEGLFGQIVSAVRYAHQQGVIHRDIKPENIMVTDDDQIKVLDFGIAKDITSGTTKTGTGMGTVSYMAPEQYTNAKKIDQRADVYALGMTLYEMVAGRLPWDKSESEFRIMQIKVEEQLPSPTEFYPYIPEEVVRTIELATRFEVEQRISSMQAMADSLNGAIIDEPVTVDIEVQITDEVGIETDVEEDYTYVSSAESIAGQDSSLFGKILVAAALGTILIVGVVQIELSNTIGSLADRGEQYLLMKPSFPYSQEKIDKYRILIEKQEEFDGQIDDLSAELEQYRISRPDPPFSKQTITDLENQIAQKSASSDFEIGFAASGKKNYSRAISSFERCLQEVPDHQDCLWELGWAYLADFKIRKSMVAWKKLQSLSGSTYSKDEIRKAYNSSSCILNVAGTNRILYSEYNDNSTSLIKYSNGKLIWEYEKYHYYNDSYSRSSKVIASNCSEGPVTYTISCDNEYGYTECREINNSFRTNIKQCRKKYLGAWAEDSRRREFKKRIEKYTQDHCTCSIFDCSLGEVFGAK